MNLQRIRYINYCIDELGKAQAGSQLGFSDYKRQKNRLKYSPFTK